MYRTQGNQKYAEKTREIAASLLEGGNHASRALVGEVDLAAVAGTQNKFCQRHVHHTRTHTHTHTHACWHLYVYTELLAGMQHNAFREKHVHHVCMYVCVYIHMYIIHVGVGICIRRAAWQP
jgi:hypothetical protein